MERLEKKVKLVLEPLDACQKELTEKEEKLKDLSNKALEQMKVHKASVGRIARNDYEIRTIRENVSTEEESSRKFMINVE